MARKRTDQVNELLRREISLIFARELEFAKGVVVTVTAVNVESKLEHATALLGIYPLLNKNATLTLIKKRAPFIQGLLNHRLHMAHIPQIRYEFDSEGNALFDLDSLIDEANKN